MGPLRLVHDEYLPGGHGRAGHGGLAGSLGVAVPVRPLSWRCPPTSYADFGRFVAALIGRYGPEGSFWTANPILPKRPIEAWQIWNEPNLGELWGGAPNAAEYSEMLKAVAPYIRTY